MIAYHVTDNAEFRVDYSHVPRDIFGTAAGQPALFASLNIGQDFWADISLYRYGSERMFVAVVEIDDTRDDAIEQGRWTADEVVITDMTAVRVVRMVECEPCERMGVVCAGFYNPWTSRCGECGYHKHFGF